MKSDPKDCLYCQNNETLHNLMIEIAQLNVSRVFLFKEQTYRGRCLVAYKDHVNDLNELSDEDRNAFMADVARVTRAMQKAFNPEKINYGAYSDKLSHLHFHLAPKYVDGPDYGGTFQMNPGKVYLSDAEYQELIDAVKANLLFAENITQRHRGTDYLLYKFYIFYLPLFLCVLFILPLHRNRSRNRPCIRE